MKIEIIFRFLNDFCKWVADFALSKNKNKSQGFNRENGDHFMLTMSPIWILDSFKRS